MHFGARLGVYVAAARMQSFWKALTFVLQTPLPVSLDLHLAQVLGTLVLQQRLISLQLTERGLHFLPAAHLREHEQS